MKWTKKVPNFIKIALKPLYHLIASSRIYKIIAYRPKSRDELHWFWRNPWDGSNRPHEYLEGKERSEFLVEIIKRYSQQDAKILEIGCGVGRNLHYLFCAGYKRLYGIEINEDSIRVLKENFSEMENHAKIYNMPIEEKIMDFQNGEFDVVFTMAVLEHIHTDSEWVFPEMARITKNLLITIEDEHTYHWRHFPRNYKRVFEQFGMQQIGESDCTSIYGLGKIFAGRIFKKV